MLCDLWCVCSVYCVICGVVFGVVCCVWCVALGAVSPPEFNLRHVMLLALFSVV